MIRFTFNGVEYGIRFQHETVPDADIVFGVPASGDGSEPEVRRVTYATIVEAKTLQPVAQGLAICHKIDVFVREQGRKVALAEALLNPVTEGVEGIEGFTKEFRRAAWEAYHGR